MGGLTPHGAPVIATMRLLLAAIVMVTMLTIHWLMRNCELEDVVGRTPGWVIGLVAGVMATLAILAQGEGNAFIYFQF